MRFFLPIIFYLLLPHYLSAQSNPHLYTWQYTTGVADSGFVKNVNARLKREDAIRLFHHNEQLSFGPPKIPIDYTPIEVLTFKNDTLLVRTEINGEDLLLLRLRRNIPALFKTVAKIPTYYWRTHEQYIAIDAPASQQQLISPLKNSNLYDQALTDIKSDRAAVAFAKDVHFLQQHHKEQSVKKHFRNRRNRIGVAWAAYQELQSYNFKSSPSRTETINYIIQMPRISLSYQRQLFSHNEALFAQLQLRTFRKKATDNRSNIWLNSLTGGGLIVSTRADTGEELSIFNVYLYPGIQYQFYKNNRVSTFLGAGAAMALPIVFKRSLEFTHLSTPAIIGNTEPFPVRHFIERGQYFSFGYYFSLGTHYQLSKAFMLSLEVRQEQLSQPWLGDESEENFYYSDLFDPDEDLAKPQQLQVQLQMLYNW